MNAPPKLLDQVKNRLRLKHYSLRTEDTYVHWIKRYIYFHHKRHPAEMGGAEVEAFLTDLAVTGKVAPSTQNQALAALLFLYREVLERDLPWMDTMVRAKRPPRLPVVLTAAETASLLARLEGTRWLIAALLYGTGMRVMECMRLRVKDIEFERREITVRDGKGGKDRVTMLPEKLVEPLRNHLVKVSRLHAADLAEGYGDVYLPFALARKYPNAGRTWAWQYVFPSKQRSVDPLSGKIRRHHLDEKVIQRAIASAAREACIAKPVSPHVLRHYAEFRTMPRKAAHGLGGLSRLTTGTRHRFSHATVP